MEKALRRIQSTQQRLHLHLQQHTRPEHINRESSFPNKNSVNRKPSFPNKNPRNREPSFPNENHVKSHNPLKFKNKNLIL